MSEPRLAKPVQLALEREASRSDAVPDWNEIAEWMIASHKRYAELGRTGLMRFPVKLRRFFGEGIWRDEGLWNIDRDAERRMANARIGAP